MSRFALTEDEIRRQLATMGVPPDKIAWATKHLALESPAVKRNGTATPRSPAKKPHVDPEGFRRVFRAFCAQNGLPTPEFEVRVLPGATARKWRWDIGWSRADANRTGGVAVDVQGGLHVRGAHVRAAGYQNDMDKRHAGEAAGWRIFYRTWQNLLTDDTVAMLRPALRALQQEDTTP